MIGGSLTQYCMYCSENVFIDFPSKPNSDLQELFNFAQFSPFRNVCAGECRIKCGAVLLLLVPHVYRSLNVDC